MIDIVPDFKKARERAGHPVNDVGPKDLLISFVKTSVP